MSLNQAVEYLEESYDDEAEWHRPPSNRPGGFYSFKDDAENCPGPGCNPLPVDYEYADGDMPLHVLRSSMFSSGRILSYTYDDNELIPNHWKSPCP